jgi:hypothetical protein
LEIIKDHKAIKGTKTIKGTKAILALKDHLDKVYNSVM